MANVQTTVAILRQQLRERLRLLPDDRRSPVLTLPKRLQKKLPAQAWPNLPPEVTLTMFDHCSTKDRASMVRHWQSLPLTKLYDVQAQAATPNWYCLTIPAHWRGELTLPAGLATHWPVLFIKVGQCAAVTIAESRANIGGLSVYIITEPQSQVNWHSVHSAVAAGQWYGAAVIDSSTICQWTVLDTHHGANIAARTIINHHLGSGARGTIIGLVTETKTSRTVYDITNAHLMPQTSGDVVWRAAVSGQARINITGWVRIADKAPQTKSFLDQRVLVRTGTPTVHSAPNLVIDSANVVASHRATVGPIDQTAKWFLTSRGVSPAQAERLLVRGFANELIPYIINPAIAASFQRAITNL